MKTRGPRLETDGDLSEKALPNFHLQMAKR